MAIYKSLVKHGYSNFTLEILEYCGGSAHPENAIKREQYYLDLLKPEYNILKVAGVGPPPHSLGYKHSDKTLAKMRSRKLSAERLAKLRDHMAKVNSRGRSEEHKAKNSAFLAKFNVSNKGFKVVVTNLETNVSVEYASISETARVLNSNKTTIKRYIQNSKPFLGIYQLETKLPVSKKGNSLPPAKKKSI